MKKTLFAVAALATMIPAMGANWTLKEAWVNPYETDTDYNKYSLYMFEKGNTDITSVQTMLQETTFSDFTTTIAGGDSIAFVEYKFGLLHTDSELPTEFSTTLTPQGNIWGVCVY